MNAEKCRPLPLGADLYREEYMKTGRVPDETEIRVFMAAVDLIQTDDTMLQLAKKAARATGGAIRQPTNSTTRSRRIFIANGSTHTSPLTHRSAPVFKTT